MPRKIAIRPGDSIVALAYLELHADVDAVWQHPDNEALRTQRKDPAVLARDDVLTVPEGPTIERFALATAREHTIVLSLPVARLRLQLVHPSGVGYAAGPATATHGDGSDSVMPDADGRLELEIPATAQEVSVEFGQQKRRLLVAHLQPVDTVAGQVARLQNLGYRPGELDGDEAKDPYALWSAIEEFQCDHGLDVDGLAGEKTQAKLLAVHGA